MVEHRQFPLVLLLLFVLSLRTKYLCKQIELKILFLKGRIGGQLLLSPFVPKKFKNLKKIAISTKKICFNKTLIV